MKVFVEETVLENCGMRQSLCVWPDIPLDALLLRRGCVAKCLRNLSSRKQDLLFLTLFLKLHAVIGHVLILIGSTTSGGHNCKVVLQKQQMRRSRSSHGKHEAMVFTSKTSYVETHRPGNPSGPAISASVFLHNCLLNCLILCSKLWKF